MPDNRKVNILLDSGAFSSWNKDRPISIKKYIAFIKRFAPMIDRYVALDVIPAAGELHWNKQTATRPSRIIRHSSEAVEKSAHDSDVNLQKMLDAGLTPIPVFHQGEDFKWLDKMLSYKTGTIGISPLPRASRRSQIIWLDDVFTAICDQHGNPAVNTHAFGVTWVRALTGYPWASADSTSWTINAGFGNIPMPPFINGEFDYGKPPLQLGVSGGHRRNGPQASFEDLTEPEYQAAVRFLSDMGLSLHEVRHLTEARNRANMTYYQNLRDYIVKRPCRGFTRHGKHLFHAPLPAVNGMSYRPVGDFRLVFSVGVRASLQHRILTAAGIKDRLMSYYEFKDLKRPERYLENLLTTGLPSKPRVKRAPKPNWNRQYIGYRDTKLIEHLRRYRNEGR